MARLTDGYDIPKSSALQSCIFPVAKYQRIAKHFISGLIGLFLFVGDVIASRTNSTTSLIPLIPTFSLYLSILEYLKGAIKIKVIIIIIIIIPLYQFTVLHCLQSITSRSHFQILCE